MSVSTRVDSMWEDDILPVLHDYVRIPALSTAFDAEWEANGHLDDAIELARSWCASRPIDDMTVEVVRLPGRTPLLLVEVPATDGSPGPGADTVLLYGHVDKQPEMVGWRDDLGPWTPVREGDRLYGRGGADDGYAVFTALGAIEEARAQGGRHARCVVLIEASEESGSPDLPAYIDALSDRIGTPSLVVCLDSGCHDYDHLWVTTSLRGVASIHVQVDVVTEGLHSGVASGIVPSSFRILRHQLDKVEDSATGRMLLPELHADPSPARLDQIRATAGVLGDRLLTDWPFAGTTHAVPSDPLDALLATTWRPTLSTIGMDGVPAVVDGGNVLRPLTRASLSVRLPPPVDPERAGAAVVAALESEPPHGAQVRAVVVETGPGWEAPELAPWLERSLDAASNETFGAPARYMGEGGSIPFMGMLGRRFPEAQFVVTGLVGPDANAHGPNEYLHIPTAKRLTSVVARVLSDHAAR